MSSLQEYLTRETKENNYESIMLLYETFNKRATDRNIALLRGIKDDFKEIYDIYSEEDPATFQHFALKHPLFRRMDD